MADEQVRADTAYATIIFALRDMGVARDHPNPQWRTLKSNIRKAVNYAAGLEKGTS